MTTEDNTTLPNESTTVTRKFEDPAELKAGAIVLRARMEKETDSNIVGSLAQAYAVVGAKLEDTAELKAGAIALRTRIVRVGGSLLRLPTSSVTSDTAVLVSAMRIIWSSVIA